MLLALLACCVAAYCLFLRRRRQRRSPTPDERHNLSLNGSDVIYTNDGEGWLLVSDPPLYATDYRDLPAVSEKKQQRTGTLRTILQSPHAEVHFPSPESFPPPPPPGGLSPWPEEAGEEDIGEHRSTHGVIGDVTYVGATDVHDAAAHSRSNSGDTRQTHSSPAPDPYGDPSPRSSRLFTQSPSGPALWDVVPPPPAAHPSQPRSPPLPDSPFSEHDEGAQLLPFPASPPHGPQDTATYGDLPRVGDGRDMSWAERANVIRAQRNEGVLQRLNWWRRSSATLQPPPPTEKDRVPSPAPSGSFLGGLLSSISRATRYGSNAGDVEGGWGSQEKIKSGSGTSLAGPGYAHLRPGPSGGSGGARSLERPSSSGHSSYHDAPETPQFPIAHPYIHGQRSYTPTRSQPRVGGPTQWLPPARSRHTPSPESDESSAPASWPRPPGIEEDPTAVLPPLTYPGSHTPGSSQGPPPSYSRDPLDDRPPVPMPAAISIIRGHTEQDIDNLRRQQQVTQQRHERLGFNRMGTSVRSFQMLSQPETEEEDVPESPEARTPPNLDEGTLAHLSVEEDLDLQQPPASLLSSPLSRRSARLRGESVENVVAPGPSGSSYSLPTRPQFAMGRVSIFGFRTFVFCVDANWVVSVF